MRAGSAGAAAAARNSRNKKKAHAHAHASAHPQNTHAPSSRSWAEDEQEAERQYYAHGQPARMAVSKKHAAQWEAWSWRRRLTALEDLVAATALPTAHQPPPPLDDFDDIEVDIDATEVQIPHDTTQTSQELDVTAVHADVVIEGAECEQECVAVRKANPFRGLAKFDVLVCAFAAAGAAAMLEQNCRIDSYCIASGTVHAVLAVVLLTPIYYFVLFRDPFSEDLNALWQRKGPGIVLLVAVHFLQLALRLAFLIAGLELRAQSGGGDVDAPCSKLKWYLWMIGVFLVVSLIGLMGVVRRCRQKG